MTALCSSLAVSTRSRWMLSRAQSLRVALSKSAQRLLRGSRLARAGGALMTRRPVITARNCHQWQQIALFLDALPKRKPAVMRATKAPAPAGGKRSAAAGVGA